ncbi:MAG TPA: PAS domain-containing sensor histidine kinase, partial [Isosphaeraceae bacterium]|nr:PAS domain-containing sensor histidine kinase [Isosphaeraceae bacterium]
MSGSTQSLVQRYGLALMAGVVAMGLGGILEPSVRWGPMSMVLVGAILVSAIGLGAGPGLLSTALVAAAAVWKSDLALALALGLLGLLACGLVLVHKPPESTDVPDEPESDPLILFEQNPGAMWVLDESSGAFLAVNQAAEQLFGYSAKELSRLTIHAFKASDADSTPAPGVCPLKGRDGSVRNFAISSRSIPYAGRMARLDLLIDLTERERSEQALRLAQKEAEDAYLALEQSVAVVGHELRTPLSPVLPAVSMMLGNDPPRPLRSMLEMIQRNVELQGRLIDDLLDVVRVDRGKLRLAVERVEIRPLINRVVEICRTDLDSGGVHLDLSVEVPEPEPVVMADPTRLLQVLWNLLRNANKFTPRGGRVRLDVRFERSEPAETGPGTGWLVAEVSDTGPGLAPEDLDRIFKPFEQIVSNDAGKASVGLGLGLAISRSIAESHRGQLLASSPGPGQGSRFCLRLPAEFRTEPQPEPRKDSNIAGGRRLKI